MLKWHSLFPWFVIKSWVLSCQVCNWCHKVYFYMWAVLQCSEFDTSDIIPYYLVSMTTCGENICIILIRIFFQALIFIFKKSFSLQWNIYFSLSLRDIPPASSFPVAHYWKCLALLQKKRICQHQNICVHTECFDDSDILHLHQ